MASVIDPDGSTGDSLGRVLVLVGRARFKYCMPGASCSGDVVGCTCSRVFSETGVRFERLLGDSC